MGEFFWTGMFLAVAISLVGIYFGTLRSRQKTYPEGRRGYPAEAWIENAIKLPVSYQQEIELELCYDGVRLARPATFLIYEDGKVHFLAVRWGTKTIRGNLTYQGEMREGDTFILTDMVIGFD